MKSRGNIPKNGLNTETCRSRVIERIHRMQNCAFVGVNQSFKSNDVERNRIVTCGLDSSRSGQIFRY